MKLIIYSLILLSPLLTLAQGGHYFCDFSDSVENSQWCFYTGRWTINNNYLYVSSETPSGVVYYYDPVYSGMVIYNCSDRAYREVYLNDGPAQISFNWMARNVQYTNRFLVLLIPYGSDFTLPSSSYEELSLPDGSFQITNGSFGLAGSSNTSWSTFTKTVIIPERQRYKLWFIWTQQFISSDNPVNPYSSYGWLAAIDDVSVKNTESFATSFEENDNLSKWHFGDAGGTEKWNVGNDVYCGGERSLYISNNGGLTNTYTNSLSSFAYAYRKVILRAGDWHVSYDWKSNGEINGDYMRVFLVSDTTSLSNIGMNLNLIPTNAIMLDGNIGLCGQSEWTHFSDTFHIPNGGLQCYKLVYYWVNNGNSIGDTPPAAIDNIAINSKKTLEITPNNPYQCMFSGDGIYDYMETVEVHISPNPHYHVKQLSASRLNNYNNNATSSPLQYISPMKDTCSIIMDADCRLYINVVIDTHIVTVTSRNNYGSVNVTNDGQIPYGQVCTVFADTSETDYRFYTWSNGVTSNPYSFVVTQDTSLMAIYIVPNESHLLHAAPSNITMGQINITGECIYQDLYQEGNIILTANANYGYHFVQWNDGVMDNPRTINLTKDTSLTAIFAVNQYTLSLSSNDATMGVISGGGTYDYLSQVTISASASSHCHFVQWSDGNTTNPRLVTVTSNMSYTAIFAQDPQYTINVMVNDPTRGSVDGGGIYYAGEYATLSASPNEHYCFSSWSDGVNANPYYLTVIEDASYIAIFEPINYTVNLTCNDDYMGSVCGGGPYPYGSTAEIEAQPFDGFRFIEWSDGNTHASRSLLVEGNVSLQARFGDAHTEGIDDVADRPIIYVIGGRIVVSGAEGLNIMVYDVIGRKITSVEKASDRQDVVVPAFGVYVVKIDGYKSQKCVVR